MNLKWLGLAAVCAAVVCDDFVPIAEEIAPGVLAVDTAPGVSLEVLDWGGGGRPLVFLAGGGHTAHEYDEFAPLLIEEFRVLGITRRGIGASSDSSPSSIDDHVDDIAAVLEALKLESAVFVGHSFAGMEMARFAEEHADRCSGLVYLDSAYDYTDPELGELFRSAPPPSAPAMTRADSASVDAVRAWSLKTQGFAMPESEIRATRQLDGSGRVVGRIPSSATRVESITPRWDSARCPAVGLYAVTAPLETWLPHYAARYESLSAEEREQGEAYVRASSAWTAKHRAAFGEVAGNRVVEFPATGHYFFLEKPAEASAAIREFVLSLE